MSVRYHLKTGSRKIYSPETQESTPRSGNAIFLSERSRVLPVSESDSFVVGSSTSGYDYSEENETEDGDDFDQGEPEFS